MFVKFNNYTLDVVQVTLTTTSSTYDTTVYLSYQSVDGTQGNTVEVPHSTTMNFVVDVSSDTQFLYSQNL